MKPSRKTVNGPTTQSSIRTRSAAPKKQRQYKPSDVHELRLKTQQIIQQTRLLHTQLTRLQDKIQSKDEAIHKIVNNADTQKNPKTYENAIKQLDCSIEGATNTRDQLKEQIEQASGDDKTYIVQELEAELKAAYCEYSRLQSDIVSKKQRAEEYKQRFIEADQVASTKNIQDLQTELRQLNTLNRDIRSKWRAYRIKIHKMEFEKRINQAIEKKQTPDQFKEQVQQETEEHTQEYNRVIEEMNKKEEEYTKNIEELQNIIEKQRRHIINFLMGHPIEEEEKTEEEQRGEKDTNDENLNQKDSDDKKQNEDENDDFEKNDDNSPEK